MAKAHFAHYHQKELADLAKLLLENYYIPAITFSAGVSRLTSFLNKEVHPKEAELLITLCVRLAEETDTLMQERKNVLVPYLKQLQQKALEGHDCATCSGKCSIQHQMHLFQIQKSHHKIKELLYHIQQLAVHLSLSEEPMNHFKFLLDEIKYIDDVVTELFFIEEAIVIPKIKDAQNAIHVYE
jgi:iron-sulfur cluster repair protein YtfE (RIC family)